MILHRATVHEPSLGKLVGDYGPEDWQDFELEVAVSDLWFPADPGPPVGPPEAAGPHRWSASAASISRPRPSLSRYAASFLGGYSTTGAVLAAARKSAAGFGAGP